jgi:ribosomal protein S18 acetylase RimI-like enzyme
VDGRTPPWQEAGVISTSATRALEEAAMRAWPALERIDQAGWVVRSAGGYTRRANSAAALAAGAEDLEHRIAWVEEEYASRGLPAIFRVVSGCGPAGLDDLLAAAGYEREGEALVMTLDLPREARRFPHALRAVPVDDWLLLYERLSDRGPDGRDLHRRLLESVHGERLLAALDDGGEVVGCGLGVREGTFAGLFDLAVTPALRGRGHGTRLVHELLRWAAGGDARTAYLQVLTSNAVAIRLYERAGFREAYRYWYRARPR